MVIYLSSRASVQKQEIRIHKGRFHFGSIPNQRVDSDVVNFSPLRITTVILKVEQKLTAVLLLAENERTNGEKAMRLP
ncbi:hypothetical protein C5F64_16545 [Photobacterium damselae subsp. damselae]|nr:hypothetical protein CAY62_14410 [Photobacterium damselae subsp. damselae]AWK83109.1 hypothetical protein BST98_14490 [Photobacterium damselae]ODA24778.1 hypothetical protein A0J46_15345 [Photobacterium damselae subsp. damselae]OEC82688.1 hypothetical protein A9D46_13445 [Photobacterium damselae subsp. damselae]PSB77389.1 hypothetical protein C5F61_11675 [Photobacterium damselae subsp. damselae]